MKLTASDYKSMSTFQLQNMEKNLTTKVKTEKDIAKNNLYTNILDNVNTVLSSRML